MMAFRFLVLDRIKHIGLLRSELFPFAIAEFWVLDGPITFRQASRFHEADLSPSLSER